MKEAIVRKEFVPVAERHINRLIKTLEEIRTDLRETPGEEQRIENECTEEAEQEATAPHITTPPVTTVLGEQLRPAAELSKGLTLNDTFRFSRELFDDDKEKMNRILLEISHLGSLTEVIAFLPTVIEWDEEQDVAQDFLELLKKYFV